MNGVVCVRAAGVLDMGRELDRSDVQRDPVLRRLGRVAVECGAYSDEEEGDCEGVGIVEEREGSTGVWEEVDEDRDGEGDVELGPRRLEDEGKVGRREEGTMCCGVER